MEKSGLITIRRKVMNVISGLGNTKTKMNVRLRYWKNAIIRSRVFERLFNERNKRKNFAPVKKSPVMATSWNILVMPIIESGKTNLRNPPLMAVCKPKKML